MALIRDRIMTTLKHKPASDVMFLSAVLSLDPKSVSGNVTKLFQQNLVSRTGKRGNYIYTLTKKGEADMRQREILKKSRELCVPRSKDNPVFAECRRNWQGYHIHKIFGSARQ